jgi:hypothetical protein
MSNELMSSTLLLEPEILSPEVALVDPGFAALPFLERDASAPWLEERGLDKGQRHLSVELATSALSEDPALEARRRLMDAGIASDVRGSMIPRGRRYRRRATLIPAFSAATSVALLVAQLYMANGTFG